MTLFAQAEPAQLHDFFTWTDWGVVFGYLLLTTWVGHALRGHQATIRDFFLGGRRLPWPAVSGSIIATAISGVTFIGVPGMVFALAGNFTYLQWAIGAIIARIIVGVVFVRAFYEEEIYSPYDYMGRRLGMGAKRLATVIFSVGAILGQSVRVLVAALALDVVTPWSFPMCIIAIGVFAILWTLMGGMQTVIWTDVMQFLLFIVGGVLAFGWIIWGLDGGWETFTEVASDVGAADTGATEWGKFSLIDLTMKPEVGFTLWVAIIATPFLNLSAYGVDQLNAQRMFCCRSQSDAKKAIIWSSFGEVITLMMLMVGAALYVWYHEQGLSPLEAAKFGESNDYVFPTWITTTLPVGLRGLILAGIFAAAISSLDSILAALSQTTLSLFLDPENDPEEAGRGDLLFWSRFLVVMWGLLLSGFAIVLNQLRGDINIVNLAFGMIAYTAGPMLALFIAALKFPQAGIKGLSIGVAASFLLVAVVRTDGYTILINKEMTTPEKVAEVSPFIDAKVPETPLIDAGDTEALEDHFKRSVVVSVRPEAEHETPPEDGGGFHYTVEGSPLRLFILPEEETGVNHTREKPTMGRDYEVAGKLFRSRSGYPGMMLKDPGAFKHPEPVEKNEKGEPVRKGKAGMGVVINYVWMWPVTFFITLACGLLLPRRKSE